MIYYHLINEHSGHEALVRVWGKSAMVIAGSSFYENFFKEGQPDTLIEVPAVNFLPIATHISDPLVVELKQKIGPRVDVTSDTGQNFQGKKLPKDVAAQIVPMLRSGYEIKAVADALGVSRQTVYRYAQKQ